MIPHNSTFRAIFLTSLGLRLIIAYFLGPGYDEAYYYTYSLHPALSYFDHPPMVALLAGVIPYITGISNAFTIRLGAVILFTVSGVVLYIISKNIIGKHSALFTYLLFNLIPLFSLGAGTMILPDSGLVFFWCLSIGVLYNILVLQMTDTKYFILAGVYIGLSILSKYHGFYLLVGFVFMLVVSRPIFLIKAKFWLSILLMALISSPLWIWNLQHNFVSFGFQGDRISGNSFSINLFLQALTGQAAYLTPFFFIPAVYFIGVKIYDLIVQFNLKNKFYFIFGILPLLLIFGISFVKPILPHWTLAPYLVLLIPAGKQTGRIWNQSALARGYLWFSGSVIVILITLLLLHAGFGLIPVDRLVQKKIISEEALKSDPSVDTYGWQDLGKYVQKNYSDSDFLFTHKWFLSGQVNLAVGRKYKVLCFNETDSRGFGFWGANDKLKTENGLFICTDQFKLDPLVAFFSHFDTITFSDSLIVYRNSKPVKTFYFYKCNHFKFNTFPK